VQVASAEPPPRVERVQVASRSRSVSKASSSARRGVTKVSVGTSRSASSTKKSSSAVVVHRVKPGQTLGGIARQYGTTVEAIRDANKVGKSVQSGQRLRIPS
jgi:N-acetylmuramoyl-L-alanine amidase